VSRHRAIVDDSEIRQEDIDALIDLILESTGDIPTPWRYLLLHDPDGLLTALEHGGHVDAHDVVERVEAHFL
jgi:hypothetical protein